MATIYVQSEDEMVFGEPATPAHYYTGISDFSTILNDMAEHKIPVNTGVVFPVVWKSDMQDPNTLPWNDAQPGIRVLGDNPWK